jgi:hypothetical protein
MSSMTILSRALDAALDQAGVPRRDDGRGALTQPQRLQHWLMDPRNEALVR